MNSSEEMEKEIRSPEELEVQRIEEGEIKDEKAEAVTGGLGEGFTGRKKPRTAHEQTPIA